MAATVVVLPDLTSNLTTGESSGVHVAVCIPCPDRPYEFRELGRRDALTRRPDDICRRNDTFDIARDWRAQRRGRRRRRRYRRRYSAEKCRDSAIRGALPKVNVCLGHHLARLVEVRILQP